MSRELHTLILAYRIVFLEGDIAEFRETYQASDRERLLEMATYHAVRPVLYLAMKKAGTDDQLMQNLQFFSSRMALQDKLYGVEMVRLLQRMEESGIAALPYKGYLFTEKIYGGQHLRESGDMDLVVRDQAVKALTLLQAEGYRLISEHRAEELVAQAQGREAGLVRKDERGMTFHLDFHWGLSESYNPYRFGVEESFEGAALQPFLNAECLLPSEEVLFKMLLNHHGGRGLWLRLKELFDFSLFVKQFREDEDRLSTWAEEVRMKRIFETGERLNEYLLSGSRTPDLTLEERSIVQAWEKGESYKKNLIPKLKRLFIYFRLQDPEVNRWTLFKRFISFHASYNPENEFPRPFGGRWEFLNFLTKLLVILYKRARGTYKTG